MTLAEKIQRIQENQEKINSHSPFPEEVLKRIHYRFRLDWNYHSHKIEGGTLTRAETRSVMVGNIEVDGKPFRDVAEMNGHDQVVRDVLKIGKGELKLSEKRLKEVHKAIIHPETPEEKNLVGNWKTEPNELINYKGEKIAFTAPQDVRELMHGLMDRTNVSLGKIAQGKADAPHPVVLAADFHIDYVTIHPFFDGNGRTARIFTNLILIACGFPPVIIRDDHKKIYSQYLGDIQVYDGSRDLFYGFLADRMLESQKLVLSAIAGDTLEEPDDLDKDILLLKQQLAAKEQVAVPITWEVFNDTVNQRIIPLLERMEQKIFPLLDLFHSIYRTILANPGGLTASGGNSHHPNSEFWSIQLTKLLIKQSETHPRIWLKGITFKFELQGLKTSLEKSSFLMSFEFIFDSFYFTITDDQGKETRFSYRSQSFENDIDKLVSSRISLLVNEIKKASGLE